MLGTKGKNVRPLSEELGDLGIDSEKFSGQVDKMSGRLEERSGHQGWHGEPPIPSYDPRQSRHVDEDNELVADPTQGGGNAGTSGSGGLTEDTDTDTGDDEGLLEALRAVKKKRKTAQEKTAAKRQYKKSRAKKKKAGKKYRARMKRKIAKREKMKRKKFGTKGLEKLHQRGKRLAFEGNEEGDDQLGELRRDLLGESTESGDTATYSPFEEAATQAGLVAMYLGEIFEETEESDIAEHLFSLSDSAADLAEELEGKESEDELDEGSQSKLENLIRQTVKALRYYEAQGEPSLEEAIDYNIEVLSEGDTATGGDDDLSEVSEPEPDPAPAPSASTGAGAGADAGAGGALAEV